MTSTPAEKTQFMRQRRDAKVYEHLIQYAPVWIIREKFLDEQDSIQFDVMFLHPQYGSVSRRYEYDSYNDVLYYKGQVLLDETETYDLQAQDPYLTAPDSNTVNSYGG